MFNNILFEGILSLVLNIVLVLFFVLIGGILPLYERKFLSLTQRRVGPKYVGYKGRMQFLADALKVLLKDYVKLYNVGGIFFFLTPVIFLNLNLFFWLNIIWLNNLTSNNIEYNLIFLLIIELVSHILIFLTGIFLKNKYTIISSYRLINIIFSVEIFSTVILSIFFLIANSFSFTDIMSLNGYSSGVYYVILIMPYIVYLFLINNSKAPFDIIEAETEIIMGYHVEYSGFLFGLYVLIEYLHVYIYLYIIYIILV